MTSRTLRKLLAQPLCNVGFGKGGYNRSTFWLLSQQHNLYSGTTYHHPSSVNTVKNYFRTVFGRRYCTHGNYNDGKKIPLGASHGEARLAMSFTCKVCNHRQTKTFTKTAYEKGVVIIECDGCNNRHLVADNLGWFDHIEARNIEQIMKMKGEEVKRYSSDGLIEIPDLPKET